MAPEINVEELFASQLAGLRTGVVKGGTGLSKQECRKYIGTVNGKHIVVTGGASGIGRDLARIAAKHGARVSIGDLNLEAARSVASEIRTGGGKALAKQLNVIDWASQRDFFKAAEDELGPIDIVVPCAGIGERLSPGFEDDIFDSKGDLEKPVTTTLEINLVGVVYSVKLAYYYLRKHPNRTGKALVLIGSMASWHPIPQGPMYSCSKAGLLGLMRSVFFEMHAHNIRTAIICPWFVDTAIIEPLYRLGLVGLPFAQLEDVTSAIIAAVSHPDQDGAALCIDPSGVFAVPFATTTAGEGNVYSEFGDRAVLTLSAKAFVVDTLKLAKIYGRNFFKTNGKVAWPLLLVLLGLLYRRRRAAKTTI